MNIGVDIRVLANGEDGGIAQYLLNLLPELFKIDRSIKFKLFFSSSKKIKIRYDWLSEKNVELFKFRTPNHLLFASSRFLSRPLADKMLGGADIFFSPHFFLAPVSSNCKSVVTFHDLSFVRHPEFFSWRQNFWHSFEMKPRQQAEKADKIIAVSRSTRNDLVSLFGINPDKIKIIYSGVSGKFFQEPEKAELEKVKTKYQLPDKFFLFLGKIEPRKNILGIFKAFSYLYERKLIAEEPNLVIAGGLGWLYKDILKFYAVSPYKRLIKFVGKVDEEDKPALYFLSKVFVYPSFFEGFGFPPLEAMAADKPVIASKTSSLPELTGNSAILVDPYDISEIAQAMANLWLNPAIFEGSKEQAKKFSWERTAEATLAVLLE